MSTPTTADFAAEAAFLAIPGATPAAWESLTIAQRTSFCAAIAEVLTAIPPAVADDPDEGGQ